MIRLLEKTLAILAIITITAVVAGGAFVYANDSSNECSPYYSVCLNKHASDIDCTQIPYTNFSVFGRDVYGLDGDNDGIACESDTTVAGPGNHPVHHRKHSQLAVVGS